MYLLKEVLGLYLLNETTVLLQESAGSNVLKCLGLT